MNISRIITVVLTVAGLAFLFIILSDPYFFTNTKKIQKTAEAKLEEGILGNRNAFKEASYYLNSLIEQGHGSRQTHDLLYWSYRYDKDFAKAEQALDEALEKFPDDLGFLYHRAEMRLEQGKYELALADYDEVIDRGKDEKFLYDALYSRGAARYRLGQKTEAEADRLKAQSMTNDTLQTYALYFKE